MLSQGKFKLDKILSSWYSFPDGNELEQKRFYKKGLTGQKRPDRIASTGQKNGLRNKHKATPKPQQKIFKKGLDKTEKT